MMKITVAQVRAKIKKLGEGETLKVGLLPTKANPNSIWISPTWLEFSDLETLESAVNAYRYYNCNSQLGLRVGFWIE